MTSKNTIQLRRATAAVFTLLNPVLADGEPGYETDTRKIKYGDGTTAWNSLPYGGSVASVAGKTGNVSLNSSDVGLGNVPNVDARARSTHTGTQTASTISNFNTAASAAAPVQSVAGKTGVVTLSSTDLSNGNSLAISNAYNTWLSSNAPTNIPWSKVAYGNNTFVAINSNTNAISMSSSDGITWTQRGLPNNTTWVGVTYGNGIFLAISSGTIAATSTDGITWTQRTIPSGNWKNVFYAKNTFIIIGLASASTAHAIATSQDGINWTSRSISGAPNSTISTGSCSWGALAYGNGLFVALASGSLNNYVIYTSPDAITWTMRVSPLSGVCWSGMAYGNNIFVATTTSSQQGMTSSDGITWTLRSTPSMNDIVFGNGKFIGPSADSPAGARISSDGITWSNVAVSGVGWDRIGYGNGTFVIPKNDKVYYATTDTIDIKDALQVSNNNQKLFFNGLSGSTKTLSAFASVQTCLLTANCTFTMPNVDMSNFMLVLTQTGSFTATFTGVKWPGGVAPTITTGANKVDVIQFVSDGTSWYGRIVQNY